VLDVTQQVLHVLLTKVQYQIVIVVGYVIVVSVVNVIVDRTRRRLLLRRRPGFLWKVGRVLFANLLVS